MQEPFEDPVDEDQRSESAHSGISDHEEDKIPEPLAQYEDSKSSSLVLMKAQTWDRESHGLYDYESRRVQKLEKKVETEGYMVRGKDNVNFSEELENIGNEEDTVLFNLVRKEGKFFVRPINENPANDRLWLVIRSIKDGYVIKRHDILKLGRMKFKVKEFRTETEFFEGEHIEKSPHDGFEELHEVHPADSEDIMCRFCWIGEQTEENPIIGSCKCAGSIKYIHFKCLKLWLDSKVNKKNDTDCHSTLNWKTFECELCKLPYPYTFMFKGKRWNLVDLKRPDDKDTPYMILESLNSEKNSSRTIHTVVINTERYTFSLGRGHDSDLRINDISVSRKHANLVYRDGKFYFVDLKSKFGTLALLSSDVEIVEKASQTFQIGRTVATLKAKLTQPWKSKERVAGESLTNAIHKGQDIKEHFLKDSQQLMNNHANSPTSSNADRDDKIQNYVPVFETNKSKRIVDGVDGHQQIIEHDGKRYLVIQELGIEEDVDGEGEGEQE